MMGRGRSNPGSTGGEIAWDILEQYAEDQPGVDAALIPSIESLRRKANRRFGFRDISPGHTR